MTTFILCGFSGAGKSTLLKRWKENNEDLVAIDLDQYIVAKIKPNWMGIKDFIEQRGIEAFRKEEEGSLKEIFLIKAEGHRLIALGGGALGPQTWELIKEAKNSLLIWVDTPFEICWERIKNDSHRPLAQFGKEKMQEIYKERCDYYQRASLHLGREEQNKIKNIHDLIQYSKQG